jgi:excisionase family DNA binding protein
MNNYLTIEGLAKYLNFETKTIYCYWKKWATQGLKVYVVGRSPRFKSTDVDSWIEKNCRLINGEVKL